MKREEADYMQDMSSKQTERIKVSEIDIIVNMINKYDMEKLRKICSYYFFDLR